MRSSSLPDMYRPSRSLTRLMPFVAAIVITLFGALLRMDALTVRYGWLEHPKWAMQLEQSLLPVSTSLRPAAVPWQRVERPYIGGDPIGYLYFARNWRHFYQAHVREPVFLAMVHFMLWVMHDSDIAVSYASLIGGSLAIFATYLLGRAAHSDAAGLIAAAALAIELDAIIWAADGWRDDTFMLFVALAGWGYIRLLQKPFWRWGVASGVIAAGACLTRITSLSFVIPALVWIGARRVPAESRRFPAARGAIIS
ncbi:MAG: glycosyltransferase family 39 protein, partial [Vicinamibacterales bacterium]